MKGGDSEDSLVDFNNIITGFYLGSLELDSSYTWEIYTLKINIDQYVQNIGNGIYLGKWKVYFYVSFCLLFLYKLYTCWKILYYCRFITCVDYCI